MKKKRIAACCLLLTIWTGLSAQQTKLLTNRDVVAMVQAGLDEPTILMAIEVNPSNFDLSVPALIELKKANVSDAVMRAMIAKRADKGTPAPAATNKVNAPSAQPAATALRFGPTVFQAFPVEFSAESFATLGANATAVPEGKVFAGKGRLRLETTGDNSSTTIVDPLKPVAYVMQNGKTPVVNTVFPGVRGSPAMTPGVSKFLLPADPQNPCENWQTLECSLIGTETLDGRATTKWDLTHHFEDAIWHSYIWVDVRLHVVSKRQFRENIFQLRNIVEGPQAASLFDVQ